MAALPPLAATPGLAPGGLSQVTDEAPASNTTAVSGSKDDSAAAVKASNDGALHAAAGREGNDASEGEIALLDAILATPSDGNGTGPAFSDPSTRSVDIATVDEVAALLHKICKESSVGGATRTSIAAALENIAARLQSESESGSDGGGGLSIKEASAASASPASGNKEFKDELDFDQTALEGATHASAPPSPSSAKPRSFGSMVFAAAPDSAPVRSGDESAGHKGDDFLKQALQYGGEDDNIAAAKEESELTHERVLKFLKSSVSILVGLVLVGVLYCTVRLRWPVSYAFYWTMVTALTVGYGDSPTCDIVVNTTDDDGAPEGFSYSGCEYRNIRDSDGDMVFVMIYSTAVVAVALSMLTEFMESLEAQQRKREAKAQRVLLEAFFEGAKIEEAKAKAVMISMLTDIADTDDEKGYHSIEEGRPKQELVAAKMAMKWKRNSDRNVADKHEAERQKDAQPTKKTGCCSKFLSKVGYWFKEHSFIRDLLTHSLLVGFGIMFMVFHQEERFVDSLYWVVISGLAVGFGDIHPNDDVGYGIGFFYITLVVLSTLTMLMKMVNRLRSQSKVHEVLSKTFDVEVMAAFDRQKDGTISRDEYLAGVLVMLDKTDFDTVDLINKHFDVLDVDKGGQISASEILDVKHAHQETMIQRSTSGQTLHTGSFGRKNKVKKTDSIDLVQKANRQKSIQKSHEQNKRRQSRANQVSPL